MGLVTLEKRNYRNGHGSKVIWFTGLPGSGKTTLAREVEQRLFLKEYQVAVIDGDELRSGISSDLGFSIKDRAENTYRAAKIATMLYNLGFVVIVSLITPKEIWRNILKESYFNEMSFSMVYIKCEKQICINRDPKGMYKKAISGEIKDFTGISSVFDDPINYDFAVNTGRFDIDTCSGNIISNCIIKDIDYQI